MNDPTPRSIAQLREEIANARECGDLRVKVNTLALIDALAEIDRLVAAMERARMLIFEARVDALAAGAHPHSNTFAEAVFDALAWRQPPHTAAEGN